MRSWPRCAATISAEHDASSGEFLQRQGDGGSGASQFQCSNGVWVVDDLLLVVERDNRRTQSPPGTVKSEITRNTNGIWLTRRPFGSFSAGALYPVHADGSVTALDWQEITAGLSLGRDCTAEADSMRVAGGTVTGPSNHCARLAPRKLRQIDFMG